MTRETSRYKKNSPCGITAKTGLPMPLPPFARKSIRSILELCGSQYEGQKVSDLCRR